MRCSATSTRLDMSLFPFKQPTRRTNYPNLFCYKTLYVSGNFSAHHQKFSTVHSALTNFMQSSKQSQDGTAEQLFKKKSITMYGNMSVKCPCLSEYISGSTITYEGWNFNSGNCLFTTDTK